MHFQRPRFNVILTTLWNVTPDGISNRDWCFRLEPWDKNGAEVAYREGKLGRVDNGKQTSCGTFATRAEGAAERDRLVAAKIAEGFYPIDAWLTEPRVAEASAEELPACLRASPARGTIDMDGADEAIMPRPRLVGSGKMLSWPALVRLTEVVPEADAATLAELKAAFTPESLDTLAWALFRVFEWCTHKKVFLKTSGRLGGKPFALKAASLLAGCDMLFVDRYFEILTEMGDEHALRALELAREKRTAPKGFESKITKVINVVRKKLGLPKEPPKPKAAKVEKPVFQFDAARLVPSPTAAGDFGFGPEVGYSVDAKLELFGRNYDGPLHVGIHETRTLEADLPTLNKYVQWLQDLPALLPSMVESELGKGTSADGLEIVAGTPPRLSIDPKGNPGIALAFTGEVGDQFVDAAPLQLGGKHGRSILTFQLFD